MTIGKECACVYFNFPFTIKIAIALNVFQQDPSPRERILLFVSLLNSFRRKGLRNFIMTSLCSNNIKENLSLKHGIVSRTYSKKPLIMASIFGSKSKSSTTMSIPPQVEPSINRPTYPKDFAKPIKAISLPQDVPSTSDLHLIELENQVQRLMEAYLAPKKPVQVHKISSSCEICSGPTTLSIAWKIPSKLLSSMHPRVTTKQEGFAAALAVLKPERLKEDKAQNE
ncbi:hypothetical protein Tco_0152308 [Tanacetum coccineum]